MPTPAIPIALTIAGSDSGGGAGIQADLRTFSAFGVHGTSAITALTAQPTRGVTAIHTAPTAFLRAQIEAVLGDFRVGAAKLGMLATPAIAREVASALARRPRLPVVLDPVLVATTGARLGTQALVASLRRLLASSTLVTPYIPEAEALLGRRIASLAAMPDAAHALRDAGARAVLLKGGHLAGTEVSDLLLTRDGEHWFHQRRRRGEFHGTGCSLSAAVAAGLALGRPLEDAVETAIHFVQEAIAAGYRPGMGVLKVLDHRAAAP
ncbi:MAG: bifunctional hydroxymethylpyrimidine kinase/phosphomethylpyrimidine kinase [Dokdonella sp.]|uniref:bifunctional hydroxymethylpyrimidine kinase/phosphomethylpyrimidine kinase n=1 Tax=Dokdonella sp. TaxID=2291710 RepID=UPI003F811C91